jgi:NAD(P)-dependent dehydrogenase (short-subunit alcohol dehydrogenase family)
VTGASGGIGAAIALRLAAAGAAVVVHYRSDPSGAEAVAAQMEHALLFGGDLTVPGVAEALVATAVERTGRLDVLINNAAVQPLEPLTAMTLAQWSHVLDTNLQATFLCSRAATARMIEQANGGSIIHIGSIEASQPAPLHAHYCASKAAIVMHARSAALELGPYGIRVNSVSPGLVRRDGLAEDWPEGVARFVGAAPLGRLVEADEVAAACLFLASPLAAAITGHDLVVDAGVSCHPTW